MKKQFVISTILCSLLIICSFSTAVPSAIVRSPPDWPDGSFKGVWSKQMDNTSGSLWGVLNPGRRATRGVFSSEQILGRSRAFYMV
jgi:hypothetical protein